MVIPTKMVTINDILQCVSSFSNVTEQAHFEKRAFRTPKRIFATLDEKGEFLNVKLSVVDQSVFATIQPDALYAVPNKWGKQGWTRIHYTEVAPDIVEDALRMAYEANLK